MDETQITILLVILIIGVIFYGLLAIGGFFSKKGPKGYKDAGNHRYDDNRYDPDFDDGYSGERWSSDGKRIQ